MTPKSMTPYWCFGFDVFASLVVTLAGELDAVELLVVFVVVEPVAVLIVVAAVVVPLLVEVPVAEPLEVSTKMPAEDVDLTVVADEADVEVTALAEDELSVVEPLQSPDVLML